MPLNRWFYQRTVSASVTSSKGYFAGGYAGAAVTTVDKVIFSTDVFSSSTSTALTQARYALAGLSEGSSKGYFAGGHTGAAVTTVDKVIFSTDVFSSSTSTALTQARSDLAGLSDIGL